MKFTSATVLVLAVLAAAGLAAPGGFVAHLTGADEVPAVTTQAQGQAIFQLNAQETALSYRLIVGNIEFVQSAHINLGAAGVNGPVVAVLFNGPTTQGRIEGVLANGTITAATLTGPLAGRTLRALLQAIAGGGAYVNVHTNRYPAGEIRGQIR
jgi:hypothetical protein